MTFRRCLLLLAITILICMAVNISSYGDVLFGEKYYEELKKYIEKAEESIVVAMYFIIMEPESPVNTLIDELIAAKKRGVEVKVTIEDAKLGESMQAYNALKGAGIDIKTDFPGKRLHIKGVIIDEKYVFLGSANWSRAGIEDNYEATLFLESPEDAKDLIQFIKNATIAEAKRKYEGVKVSDSFILSPNKGRMLLKNHADKQLDLYLLLLREYKNTGKTSFKPNGKELLQTMGYKAPENIGSYRSERNFYRDTIRKFLNSMRDNELLEFTNGIVTLDTEGMEESHITIPFEYWNYGYDKVLSMRAKYLYLISLYEASRSIQYPSWFHSQEDMSKVYGIHADTISKGLTELERIGVIEVTRSKPRPPDFSQRKANVYTMLPLKPLNESYAL